MSPLEDRIVSQLYDKYHEVFGDEEVQAVEGDERFTQIDEFISNIVKDFPQAKNGSRYIKTYCMVTPKLIVSISQLEPILSKAALPQVIGKHITFGPLCDPILGDFTTKSTTLKLKNIRFDKWGKLKPKSHAAKTLAKQLTGKKLILLGQKEIPLVYIEEQTVLQKTAICADVKFGSMLKAKNQEIELAVEGVDDELDEESAQLCILLPSERVKIRPDGTATLKNGTTFHIEDLIGEAPVDWIDHEFDIESPFLP